MKRCPICRTTYPGLQAQYCPTDGSVLETVTEKVDPLVGTTLEGKYRIVSRLGAGGMGAVYKAHHLLLGRDVAVKVLKTEVLTDSRSAERFRREAQAAARIEHANAVTIYDFGISADGNAYLVMELLRGTSLRDILDRDGRLSLDRAVEIFVNVCAGIDRAHQLGVVHRDIKPDNIMVDERPDGSVQVKVVDFGIAMLQDMGAASRLTGTGMVLGTANYMSPEHCRGDEMDARSDIYALGVTLFEMLTGRVPFSASIPSAVIVAHVNETPPWPRVLRPDLPPAVERVVLDALAKRPDDRPRTAGELSRRLVAAATGAVSPSNAPTVPVPGVTTDERAAPGGAPITTPAPGWPSGPAPTPPTMPAAGLYTPSPSPPPPRSGLSPVVAGIVAVAMLAIGAVVAVVAISVMNWRNEANANNSNTVVQVPSNTSQPPPANVSVPPPPVANTNVSAPPPPIPESRPITADEEREVDEFLGTWTSSSEQRDIEWHLGHYADVVDYYKAGPVARFRIRADRVRAYEKYETIELRVTAVREATANADGTEYRLVIDKEWRFANADGESTGKVKQLIGLRRVDNELKIVTEKDLAVY